MRLEPKVRFLCFAALSVALCGCGEAGVESTGETVKDKSASAQTEAPTSQTIAKPGKITFGEEDMGDFDIPISKNIENPDGSRTVEAVGEINGKYAGFKADISPNIDRVKISSLGKVSDIFLNELAKKYEKKAEALTMNAMTELVCINMGKEDSVQCMKLFYGTEAEDASKYAELYLNVDFKKNILEFHEKDPDYREAVLKVLTKN
ncbi:MAG: hypothetical protein KIT34_02010 [Cyanobacteria bacterium TGS_CYA1]|nr:hypothetical protein [Cyanobacteria bacterium TGS_CYA1]